ncbi:hypothetical protein A33M_3494 [Rhodovulum sp. PH10]|uniref:hypothetical protein n=1 Tax=Rhodovulum sp. PH10 TaxID=1187851 RepID=UPI00027C1F85|nr:hypothetical protein [Rhodovulum sp. PH10]EJW13510.1 hypothetical protein A33M_3494 [Rhodovulum sp. PH10]
MFFRERSATAARSTFLRGIVRCPRCGGEIPFHKVEAVADEFSLGCGACGHRGFFRKSEIAVQQMPERRRRPR